MRRRSSLSLFAITTDSEPLSKTSTPSKSRSISRLKTLMKSHKRLTSSELPRLTSVGLKATTALTLVTLSVCSAKEAELSLLSIWLTLDPN